MSNFVERKKWDCFDGVGIWQAKKAARQAEEEEVKRIMREENILELADEDKV